MQLRRFRISIGGGLAAVAAAAVALVVMVVPASGSQSVQTTAPTQQSLSAYASAHGGKHVVGPELDGSAYVGAYSTTAGVVVVRYIDNHWRPDGSPVAKYNPVRHIAPANGIVPGHAGFVVHQLGGDVSYFGGVLYDAGGTWKPAHFAKCAGHKNLSCSYGGATEPYGHVAGGAFVSVHNDCKPNCAAGTNHVVTWRWSTTGKRFVVASVVKYEVYKAGER